jgi:hypothetical protein
VILALNDIKDLTEDPDIHNIIKDLSDLLEDYDERPADSRKAWHPIKEF